MYRKGLSRASPPPMVQSEPEDLSSPHPPGPSRGSSDSATTTVPIVAISSVPGSPPVVTGGPWPFSKNKLLMFCDIVLKHANYPHAFLADAASPPTPERQDTSEESGEETKGGLLVKNERVSESPLNSVGESVRESNRSSTSSTDSVLAELETEEVDKETFESVSCWCGKPFAGRPMIECDKCLVWFHMSCEQVRRNNIPHLFQCSQCKEKRRQKKRSSSGAAGGSSSAARKKEESRRKRSKGGAAAAKKRKSSASSPLGMPGSANSPTDDTNASAFLPNQPSPPEPLATASPMEVEEEPEILDNSPGTTDKSEDRLQPDVSCVSPTQPPPVTSLIKIKRVPATSRHRDRKSKSSSSCDKKKKKRKRSGDDWTITSTTSLAVDQSSTNDPLLSAPPPGLPSTPGESPQQQQHHQPPPRLLPCFEASPPHSFPGEAASTPASTTNGGKHSGSGKKKHASSSNGHRRDHDQHHPHHPHHHHAHTSSKKHSPSTEGGPSSSKRSSLPPPKLQPQVSLDSSQPPSASSSPPPPLLLSSNFVVDHQPHHQSGPFFHRHHHHRSPGVIVGGAGGGGYGDTTGNHPYPFRQ